MCVCLRMRVVYDRVWLCTFVCVCACLRLIALGCACLLLVVCDCVWLCVFDFVCVCF